MNSNNYRSRIAVVAATLFASVQLTFAQVNPPVPADSLINKDQSAPDQIIRKSEPVPPNAQPAQVTPAAPTPPPFNTQYTPKQFVKEFGPFITSPLKWKVADWAIFAGIGLATFGSMQYDENIRDFSLIQKPRHGNNIEFRIGEQWGGFYASPIISMALYVHGWVAKNHKTKRMGFEIAQAVAYGEAISFTSKNLIGRYRPFLNRGAFHFVPLSKDALFQSPHNSFPAGHMVSGMAMSVVLAKSTDNPFLRILAFTPAVLCGVERVLNDQHWTSDVVIGGALGYVVGTWVVNYHDKKEAGLQVSSLYPVGVKYVIK